MQAAAVLANADGVVTTDCGIMHMAGAVNARVLAVFGPTHPGRLCPPGVRHIWRDEARYSFAYEDFGVVPAGPFYGSVEAAQVVDAFENL
jgi:ADP-heptose:LPS heptosyltransferase